MRALAQRPRLLIALILTATVLGGGGVGFAVAGGFDRDRDDGERLIAAGTAGGARSPASATRADRSPDVVVDGAIRAADARRAISAAANRVDGVALTVDRDDGRYEVDMQRPDGTIAEVLVDDRFRALGIDPGD